MTETPPEMPRRWNKLLDPDKGLLFARLHARISSRIDEQSEWGRLVGKILVGANGTAAAATIAFIASVYAKTNVVAGSAGAAVNQPSTKFLSNFGYSTLLFLGGFITAVIFMVIVYSRVRDTLRCEARYLSDVIHSEEDINWETNPRIQQLPLTKLIAGAIFAFISITLFTLGAFLGLIILILNI